MIHCGNITHTNIISAIWKHSKRKYFFFFYSQFFFISRYPFTYQKSNPFIKIDVNQKIYNFLHDNLELHKECESIPPFLAYWNISCQILDLHGSQKVPMRRLMMCGINAEPRDINQQQLTENSLEKNSSQISPPEDLISISLPSEEDSGCCHDQVKKISLPIFNSPSFVSLCSIKFQDPSLSELWISQTRKQVSLECMESSMDELQIKARFYHLISEKFFL